MTPEYLDVRVVERRMEACDVAAFRLVSERSELPLPSFDAGAHIDVLLPTGKVRQYSLSNCSDRPGVFEIAVKLEQSSGGGSRWLHEEVFEGAKLKISPPRNHFPLHSGSSRSILLAAGIGITPIIAMMRAHLRDRRPYELHYFARGGQLAAYRSALLRESPGDSATIHLGLDANLTGKVLDQVIAGRADDHLYFCGPPGFMAAVRALAEERMPGENIHFEYFAAPKEPRNDAVCEFEVELARSYKTLVIPADKSITDVLFEHDVAIDTSCESGICGSCKVKVLAGTPHHLDEVLSPSERARNDCLLPCVSRALSGRLVLDL